MPGLADEYDFILGKVMDSLSAAKNEDGIVSLLVELERDYLCLPVPRPDLCARAAKRLLELRRTTERWPNATPP
jgi:hypothetical protein